MPIASQSQIFLFLFKAIINDKIDVNAYILDYWRLFMGTWKDFISADSSTNSNLKKEYNIYDSSVNISNEASCFMAIDEGKKVLIVTGGSRYGDFEGLEQVIDGKKIKVCPLNIANSKVIQSIFEFTNPSSAKNHSISMGLGDRLGLASPGHIRLLSGKNIFPILAQQSIRELNLTLRTYEDVLAEAVWAVFQEGYKDGFGADGDHLKTPEEVQVALDCGFTMITLDCSEHIDNSVESLSVSELESKYDSESNIDKKYWEDKYNNKTFNLSDGSEITIDTNEYMKTVLTYSEAICFAEKIYNNLIKNCDFEVDFEISIDETLSATTLEAHFIIANEFNDRNVKMLNMAPRFCGEFQKGIDYRGNINQFTEEFKVHFAISKHFGYKISVHSGSDKFSIFPIVGELSEGRYHLKTAGTNWLEAMRVIAITSPDLFKAMYKHALKRLPDAKKFYHIFTEPEMVPDINEFKDNEFTKLMDIEESRQAIHVTYGYLLTDKDEGGDYLFREDFFDTLNKHEDEYYMALANHICHHIEKLNEKM